MHYGSFELDAESPDTPLSRFRFRAKDRFAYLYDMGDFWEHEVRIEKFLDRKPKQTYPVCTGGAGACPPEDCGGPPGYLERQEEATGWDAWSDRDLVVGFVSDVLEGQSAGSLTEDDREATQAALERMEQRQPFLDTTFSRRTVNDAFPCRPPPSDDAPATHIERRRGSASRSAAKAPTTSPWFSDIRRTKSWPVWLVTWSNLRRSMATLVSA